MFGLRCRVSVCSYTRSTGPTVDDCALAHLPSHFCIPRPSICAMYLWRTALYCFVQYCVTREYFVTLISLYKYSMYCTTLHAVHHLNMYLLCTVVYSIASHNTVLRGITMYGFVTRPPPPRAPLPLASPGPASPSSVLEAIRRVS